MKKGSELSMQKRKKSVISVFVSLTMLAALLIGCSGGNNNNTAPQSSNPSPNASETTATPNEEVGYPESLTYFTVLDQNVAAVVKNLSEIGAYRKIKEATNTQVEFQHPAADGNLAAEQFNLMMTSGKLPDVIEWNWANVPNGPDSYIKEKRIIRLNELIEAHAPNFSKYLEENPEVKKAITTDEGNIYSLPFLRGDDYLMTFQGPIIRQDWLDKVDLSIPTTIDEWETVLRAFKETDLNGNGEADEIPFLFEDYYIGTSHVLIGAWGITSGFYQEDGQVKYGPIQPAYKDFITTMNNWYKDGLIDRDFANTDLKLKDAKIVGEQLGIFVGNTGGGIGKYIGLMAGKDTPFKLAALPYPTLKAGDKPLLGQKDPAANGWGSAISASAKNPEGIVKWLDYGYSEEGHMLFNFGIEGESYTMDNSYPTYTDEIMKNPDGLPLVQALGKYVRASTTGPFVQDRRYMEQYSSLPEQVNSIEVWKQPENTMQMPILTLTPDESSQFASIMNDINTFKSEKTTKYIMNVESVDSFDEFVKTINSMGIEEAIKIQQAALDRYNTR
jgi:putative aldouronate transport system substrate-binding protein